MKLTDVAAARRRAILPQAVPSGCGKPGGRGRPSASRPRPGPRRGRSRPAASRPESRATALVGGLPAQPGEKNRQRLAFRAGRGRSHVVGRARQRCPRAGRRATSRAPRRSAWRIFVPTTEKSKRLSRPTARSPVGLGDRFDGDRQREELGPQSQPAGELGPAGGVDPGRPRTSRTNFWAANRLSFVRSGETSMAKLVRSIPVELARRPFPSAWSQPTSRKYSPFFSIGLLARSNGAWPRAGRSGRSRRAARR